MALPADRGENRLRSAAHPDEHLGMPSPLRQALPGLAALAGLASVPSPTFAQAASPTSAVPTTLAPVELVPTGWFSGDTHEHIQLCDDTALTAQDILARMELEDLDVASILIWQRSSGLSYVEFICNVPPPGPPVTAPRLVQFGVETSGLTCSLWGHMIGLGIGPAQARIALGSLAGGACADMPGLGLPGDGSGL